MPLDDLDQRMQEKAELVKEWVPELDTFVEKLDVLAKLAGE